MSSWFMFFSGWFGCVLVIMITNLLTMSKKKKAIKFLDDEEKKRLLKVYSMVILIYKIMFWMIPLQLFVIRGIYIYDNKDWVYITTMLIMVYIFIIGDFFFKKSIINEVKQN